MVGRSLEHYELVERLGAGGMGEVYRARDTKLDRDVAIKTLPDGLAEDRDRLSRLRREAKLLAALNHPNIATIHDLVEVGGTVFLVLELLDGRSLHQRLEEGPLAVAEAVDVARQIAEALEVAHDKGIVHRDLKPSNVMLVGRGRVKVLDFGIGKALGLDDSTAATLEESAQLRTAPGALVGTAPYISPEQIRGQEVDQRADVWAFGCVLYEMLAGRRAFHRETVADTLAAVVEGEPDWSRLPAETPEPVVRMMRRMLHEDPDQRARDVWHLRLELADVLQEPEENGELTCPGCGSANPVSNRFCSECGAKLRRQCPDCGTQVAPGAVFCGNCGSSLTGGSSTGADEDGAGKASGAGEEAVGLGASGGSEVSLGGARHERSSPDPAARTAGAAPGDVSSDSLLAGERRQATVLCSALAGYHELLETVGPDRTDRLLGRVREKLEEAAGRHDGLVNRFTGDELVVLFGVPVAHERDPLRAVRTALELHGSVGELADELGDELADRSSVDLRLRTAVDSGSVLFRQADGDEPYRLSGEPLQLAGALRGQARDDEILLSPRCARLIGPRVKTERRDPVTLQGRLMRPYTALAEADVGSPVDAPGPGGLTPYSGRDPELRQLEERLEQAREGEGQFVTVVGEAGAGKSRLLHEFRRVCREVGGGEMQLLQGRCQASGHGVPYLPFLGALRDCLELDTRSPDPSATAVESVRGIDPDLEGFVPFYLEFLSIPSDEHPMPKRMEGDDFRVALQEALAALFTLAARRQPTVMLLEDWHWADESSEDLLLQIAGMLSAYPLLVVVTYRPERTFDWGRVASPTSIRLGPLDRAASAAIIQSVLEVDDVSDELVDIIHDRTGGNPFFLEEICRTLEEEGSLTVRGGRAAAASAPERLHLPDTVQAVIRTRLDRIDRRARDVLRVASVVGREFSRSILAHTVASDEAELGSILEELKSLGLVQQLRVLPERTYRFNHALTQEVTYESLLQHQRKRLHGLVGEAIEELYPERIDEHLDRLARHFSRAEEWGRAVVYGMRAAERYSTLSQFPEARKMLEDTERWLSRMPESPERQERLVELLFRRERVGEHLGDLEGQETAIERLLELLEPAGDSSELAEVTLRQGELQTLQKRFDEAEEALSRSLRISRTLLDEVAERRALRSMGFLHWQQGHHDSARDFAERALEIGRRLQDPEAVVTDLSNLASVLRSAASRESHGGPLSRGPGRSRSRPVDSRVAGGDGRDSEFLEEARAYIDEALEVAEEIPLSMERASAMWIAAEIYGDLGHGERAIHLLEEAHELARRQRFPHHQHLQMIALANHHWSQGRIEESLEHYEKAVAITRRFHAAHGLSESLRALGEAFLTLQRTDEAISHLGECADLFGRLGDRESEAVTRANLAAAHEQRGDDEAAAAAWEKVLALRRGMEDRAGELKALEGIGRALRELDPDVARSHLTAALELAEDLGDPARQADLRNSIGILEWRRNNFEEALAQYERALELLEEIGDQKHCGLVLNSLGVVLKELGRQAEARERLEEARRLNRECGATLLEAHSLAVLADLAAEGDRPEEATGLYEESLSLRRRAGDRKGEGWMLLGLARVTSARDDAEAAQAHLEEARKIAREVDDPDLVGACQETGRELAGR